MTKTAQSGQNPSKLIQILSDIKSSFGGDFPTQKLELLHELSDTAVPKADQLLSYHESLCYLRAFPDNAKVLAIVESELAQFHERVNLLKSPDKDTLDETGIVGTKLSHPYAYFMTKWLLKKYPKTVDIDWNTYKDLENDPILDLLPELLTYCENDAVDDPFMPTTDIIDAETSVRGVNRLEWFMDIFERLSKDERLKRLLFDKMDIPLTIDIGNQPFARTNVKLASGEMHYQKQALEKEYPDLRKITRKIDLKPKLLPKREAEEIVNMHKMAMIMRHRELWPLTFANLDEVYATALGRGMTIYIMGMMPEWRLPLESNYAALLVRNGVPIGYGIGAMVFDRIEIAINIFETFRRSEAGFIFGKFAQLFNQMFGCSYLLIRRYQVGYDNPEGLDSGAYWFYYKLGFRSIDESCRKLADAEAAKIASDKSYRTSKAVLKELAESDLCLDLKRRGEFTDRDISLSQISLAQTRFIASHFNGDRSRAEREAPELARRTLVLSSTKGWTPDERLWFNRLALFALSLPNLEEWVTRDKQNLVSIMKSKGALREQDYVKSLREHRKLTEAINELLTNSVEGA